MNSLKIIGARHSGFYLGWPGFSPPPFSPDEESLCLAPEGMK
jgi:hypothetical protein